MESMVQYKKYIDKHQLPPNRMNGSRALIETLLKEDVDTLFGYPGGQIIPVYDALYDYKELLNHVLVRHEQAAVHAAQGYARVSAKVGVCLVTSGPGATNTVTGLADAMADSTPVVVISGQVGVSLLGSNAFQEVDIINITQSVSKWSYQITHASEIPGIIARAFFIARSGRPGPVVIDITRNAQLEMMDFYYEHINKIRGYTPVPGSNPKWINKAAELINGSQRPMALIGQGVSLGKAEKELIAFIEKSGIPVASSLLGLSSVPTHHPLYVGMLGMHGNYAPNIKNKDCDLLIAIGIRFNDRVTGDPRMFGSGAGIIHMDIDPSEINKIIRADVPILGNVKDTLPLLTSKIDKRERTEWVNEFRQCAEKEYDESIRPAICPQENTLHMGEVVSAVSRLYDDKAILVTDVGQQQMVACRYFGFTTPRSLVTSGGLGTMGFGLPAAIGAQLGALEREVCLFTGDGGLQMTIQELCTLAQLKLPVKIILLNNGYLGMVRQWQELFHHKRYSFTEMTNPDFGHIARGNNIAYQRIEERSQLSTAIHKMKKHPGPYLLEVIVRKEENVFPMIPAGAAVSEIRLK